MTAESEYLGDGVEKAELEMLRRRYAYTSVRRSDAQTAMRENKMFRRQYDSSFRQKLRRQCYQQQRRTTGPALIFWPSWK